MGVRQIVGDIQDALRQLKTLEHGGSLFNKKREEGLRMLLQGGLRRLVDETKGAPELHSLALKLSQSHDQDMQKLLEQVAELVQDQKEMQQYSTHFLPADVRDVVEADLERSKRA